MVMVMVQRGQVTAAADQRDRVSVGRMKTDPVGRRKRGPAIEGDMKSPFFARHPPPTNLEPLT